MVGGETDLGPDAFPSQFPSEVRDDTTAKGFVVMSYRSFAAVTAVVALTSLAGTAQATFFSMASDNNTNNFTFAGTAGSGSSFSITQANTGNTFNLLVNNNNGGTTVSVPVEFRASLTASAPTVSTITTLGALTLLQYTYRVTGTISFLSTAATVGGSPVGTELLRITVGQTNPGIFTVPGTQFTGQAATWTSTGAVLGADSYADVTYTAFTPFVAALGGTTAASNLGIQVGAGGSTNSAGPDDFGFDLTVINGGTGLVFTTPVAIGTNNLPTNAWRAESSFSGSALGGIPTPGATALLGVAGILAFRRRR